LINAFGFGRRRNMKGMVQFLDLLGINFGFKKKDGSSALYKELIILR